MKRFNPRGHVTEHTPEQPPGHDEAQTVEEQRGRRSRRSRWSDWLAPTSQLYAAEQQQRIDRILHVNAAQVARLSNEGRRQLVQKRPEKAPERVVALASNVSFLVKEPGGST